MSANKMEFYYHGKTKMVSLAELGRALGLPTPTVEEAAIELSYAKNSKKLENFKDGPNKATPWVGRGWNELPAATRASHRATYGFTDPAEFGGPTSQNVGAAVTLATIMAKISSTISLLVALKDEFSYEGFKPLVVQQQIINICASATPFTARLGSSNMVFNGPEGTHNTISFICMIGLTRGNSSTKIIAKSRTDVAQILTKFQLQFSMARDGPKTYKPMRFVQCFPQIALQLLISGCGRNLVGGNVPLVLSHSFVMSLVPKASFKTYAAHFLALSYKTDAIIGNETDVKKLWNYMVAAFNSDIVSNEDRDLVLLPQNGLLDLGDVDFGTNEVRKQITDKIDANDTTTFPV